MVCELEISNSRDGVSGVMKRGDRPLARPICAHPKAPLGRWGRPSAERNGLCGSAGTNKSVRRYSDRATSSSVIDLSNGRKSR